MAERSVKKTKIFSNPERGSSRGSVRQSTQNIPPNQSFNQTGPVNLQQQQDILNKTNGYAQDVIQSAPAVQDVQGLGNVQNLNSTLQNNQQTEPQTLSEEPILNLVKEIERQDKEIDNKQEEIQKIQQLCEEMEHQKRTEWIPNQQLQTLSIQNSLKVQIEKIEQEVLSIEQENAALEQGCGILEEKLRQQINENKTLEQQVLRGQPVVQHQPQPVPQPQPIPFHPQRVEQEVLQHAQPHIGNYFANRQPASIDFNKNLRFVK